MIKINGVGRPLSFIRRQNRQGEGLGIGHLFAQNIRKDIRHLKVVQRVRTGKFISTVFMPRFGERFHCDGGDVTHVNEARFTSTRRHKDFTVLRDIFAVRGIQDSA